MANDMVDTMLEAVSGLEEVGYDLDSLPDHEVGAIVKRAKRQRAAAPLGASPAPAGSFVRSSRDVLRRAPGGFPNFSAAAGASATQSITVSRAVDISRLTITPSGPGLVMDSMKIGDEEQLLTSGVPVEMYGATVYDTRPDNFTTLPAGIPLSITLRNTTAGTLTANIGFKGEVKR